MLTEAFWGQTPFVSKVAHSHGCWQEASAPHHPDLSRELSECPHDRASFSKAHDLREHSRNRGVS